MIHLVKRCAIFLVLLIALSHTFAHASIVKRAIPIGGGLKIDIHAPDSTKRRGLFLPGKKAPILLYVHGGGWVKGTRAKIYKLDKFATSRGWMLVSTDYRPVPRTTIDGQVNDVVRAIRWVRSNIKRHGGNPKKIVIMGHSAGSHLVSLVAARKAGGKLRGVIANDVQAYDMVAYAALRGSIDGVYLRAFGQNPANWVRWSPITYVRRGRGFPPFLVMYSRSHRPRRAQLSVAFAKELRKRGTRVTLYNGKKYTHGAIASRIGSSPDVTRAVERFLRRAFF